MKKRSQRDIKKNTELAKCVIKHLFGSSRAKLIYKPTGQTNFVFEASLPDGEYIVRISKSPGKLKNFTKEQWAVAQVKKKGVPVAEILEVGNDIIPLPYMVLKKINGIEALYHPDKKKVLRQIGEHARLINSIKTTGFGKVFDWSQNQLSKNSTWKDFLENELELEKRLQILEKHKMLNKMKIKRLKANLENLDNSKLHSVLTHGDMRRKNIIVSDQGEVVAIIDWEECCSMPAPFWELSIALHDLSVDDKQHFLEGYDITPAAYLKLAGSIKSLNIINYAPTIEKLAKRKETHTLDFYRARLRGDFDLYSL